MSRKRRSGCRRLFGPTVTLVFFPLLFLVGGGIFFWRALSVPYKGFEEPSVLVEVERGHSVPAIMRRLQSKGVLRDEVIPTLYMRTLRRGVSLKAGLYRFEGASTPLDVIDKLARGDVEMASVTIREGLDRFQIARIMAEAGFGTSEQWEELTASADLVSDLDSEATSLEGYLFPDTYTLTPGTSARVVVDAMVNNFRNRFGEELAFISNGLSVHETVTLASIVETEARIPDERPVVASVYLNRVRRGMLLQADPTLIYALKLEDQWDGNLTRENLRTDSPYNTYVTPGFPPGPIANPGLASLRAAASPAQTDFLYFVSRNDGSHVFARTLAEHNRNVERWQRQYWREQRKKAGAGSSD